MDWPGFRRSSDNASTILPEAGFAMANASSDAATVASFCSAALSAGLPRWVLTGSSGPLSLSRSLMATSCSLSLSSQTWRFCWCFSRSFLAWTACCSALSRAACKVLQRSGCASSLARKSSRCRSRYLRLSSDFLWRTSGGAFERDQRRVGPPRSGRRSRVPVRPSISPSDRCALGAFCGPPC